MILVCIIVQLNSYGGDPSVCVCIWAECDPDKNLLSTIL